MKQTTTLRRLADSLQSYIAKNPGAADFEVCANASERSGGVATLSLHDAKHAAVQFWKDECLQVHHYDESSDGERDQRLGPYHVQRRSMVFPFALARCEYFTYRGTELHRLDGDKLVQAWYGQADLGGEIEDGDLPLLVIMSTVRQQGKQHAYFMRACVEEGMITPASQKRALDVLLTPIQGPKGRRGAEYSDTSEQAYQRADWPADWKEQVLACPDLPDWPIEDKGIGGPLCYSLSFGMEVRIAAFLLATGVL